MITHHRSSTGFPDGSTFEGDLQTYGPFTDGRTYRSGRLIDATGGEPAYSASICEAKSGNTEFRWSCFDGVADGSVKWINHDEASAA